MSLLSLLIAESGLNPHAERFGTRTQEAQRYIISGDWAGLEHIINLTWPDISFGLSQLTVSTAASYGIGSGSKTAANCIAVRRVLFDRWTAISLGARHFARSIAAVVRFQDPEPVLAALIHYNSGAYQPRGNWYWERWTGNIYTYRQALIQAVNQLT